MKQIVVVGAGIGGLTTALCLKHFGINACVYERSNEVTTAGAGIQLSPNANSIFPHRAFDEVSALSRRCKGVRVFDYKSNSQLALFDYMKFKRDAAFLLPPGGPCQAFCMWLVKNQRFLFISIKN